jgi:hypothetical protein
MPFNPQTLEASLGNGLVIYTTLVHNRITASVKEVLRTFPKFQTNAMYLKTGQHRILLSVSQVTGHNLAFHTTLQNRSLRTISFSNPVPK